MAVVAGRLQIRGWTDKDGNKRRTAEIVADNVYFGEKKQTEGTNSDYVPPQQNDDFPLLDGDDGQFPF